MTIQRIIIGVYHLCIEIWAMHKKLISLLGLSLFIFSMNFFIGAKRIGSLPDSENGQYALVRSPFDNKTYPVPFPQNIDFAGEAVPLYDFDVIKRLDRELLVNTYWQSQTLYLIKEFNQISTTIKPILKKNKIPEDFIYLAVAESGLQGNQVSPKGATGIWQFMGATAKHYGLEVNEYVDERYNLEKSTEAACKYLKDAYARFNNWTLAAASFNIGQEALDKTMKVQEADSYYDLFLNRETSRYIFRILALKQVMKNPKQYGYHVGKSNTYPELKYKTVKVDSAINDLALFATQQKTNYKMLKIFNPWLINSSLPKTEGKTYEIKIPDASVMEEEAKLFVTENTVQRDSL